MYTYNDVRLYGRISARDGSLLAGVATTYTQDLNGKMRLIPYSPLHGRICDTFGDIRYKRCHLNRADTWVVYVISDNDEPFLGRRLTESQSAGTKET